MSEQRTIDLDAPCVEYEKRVSEGGYSKVVRHGRNMNAHRSAYIDAYGEESVAGLVVDHMCENRLCVNILHLHAITHEANVAKGNGPTALNARKTHCIRGHEFTPENTYKHGRRRQCRACGLTWKHAQRAVEGDNRG